MQNDLPEKIAGIDQLEELLSEPSEKVVEVLSGLDGDILVLGAGGKMGPSLGRMAKRATDIAGIKRDVLAVSRFTSAGARNELESHGIRTIPCDLLDDKALQSLPDAANVVFMAGTKFGSTGNESLTWAMNVYLPGRVCERYRSSRIAAFSSGNVYGLVPINSGGSIETDTPDPVGEYANSVLGRERVFEHFSKTLGIRTSIIRLNYAVEMRYGVLVDIARKVFAGEPVDVSMGYINVIWQGDANAMALASFDVVSSPPFVLNVSGPELVSVRKAAEQFGEMFGRETIITGVENPDALLNNGLAGHVRYGSPQVDVHQMMVWIADWISTGGENIGKPTHFETRDGKY